MSTASQHVPRPPLSPLRPPGAHLLVEEPQYPERLKHNAFRDPAYIDEEDTLDAIIERAIPEFAIPIEADLIARIDCLETVSEGLARTALKAIGVAQVARQLHRISIPTEDTTYQTLGRILDKAFNERERLTSEGENASRERGHLIGTMSEIAFYMLAAYDASFTRPLSGQITSSDNPRYILPSTFAEDSGYNKEGGRRIGFDFQVTYQHGKNPHRFVQVKTSPRRTHTTDYIDEIKTVAITPDLTLKYENPITDLISSIANDARGEATGKDSHRVHIASRRLNTIIR